MMKASTKTIFGLALAGVALTTSSVAMAERTAVSTDGGLKVYEGDFWFKLDGRMQFDQTFFDSDNNNALNQNYPSGSHIRRAELTTKGGFYSDWSYKLQLDFADQAYRSQTGGSHIKEAFIAYVGMRDSTFALGQISAPLGLEGWTSADAGTFLEPSLMTYAFAPNYGLGLYADYVGHNFTVAGALYHPADQANSGSGTTPLSSGAVGTGSDRVGAAARVTFAPVHTENQVWHLGVSGLYQDQEQNSTNTVAFRSVPEALARDYVYSVNTGNIANVDDYTIWGVEAAYLVGPFSAQAEYQAVSLDRLNTSNTDFNGFYGQVSYVLTGESRIYDFDSGTFENVKPRMPCGAWEVAARYSYVGLNDNNIYGGSEHNVAVGVNWYANNNLKVQGNYVHADLPSNNLNGPSHDVDALAFRAQVVW